MWVYCAKSLLSTREVRQYQDPTFDLYDLEKFSGRTVTKKYLLHSLETRSGPAEGSAALVRRGMGC